MKKLKILLLTLAFGNAIYFLWSKRLDLRKSFEPINTKKITKIKIPLVKNGTSTNTPKEFNSFEIKNYINNLNKTIKAQYKEVEECEKEFDVHFRDLLEMTKEKQLEYLKDRNNLEYILDKFSSITFTTLSSAKVIEGFANPISASVRITDIYHKPGLQDRVETCSPRGKMDILELLYKSKIQKKDIMRGLINFFENEISTLDYPWILFNQIIELKKLLKLNGIPESKYPGLGQIEKDFKAFDIKIKKIMNEYTPRKNATWDYQEAKLEYEFALKLQADIKSLLKGIKEDLTQQ